MSQSDKLDEAKRLVASLRAGNCTSGCNTMTQCMCAAAEEAADFIEKNFAPRPECGTLPKPAMILSQEAVYNIVADAVQEIADAAEEAFKKAGLTDPGEWDSDNIVEDVKRGIVSAIGRMTPLSASGSLSVPEGMKCVPTKPTPRMLETVGPITGYEGEHPDKDHSDWYAAMIEAAPTLTYARSTTGQWSDEDRRLAEHTAAQLAVSWYERRHLTHHQGDLIVRALKAVSTRQERE